MWKNCQQVFSEWRGVLITSPSVAIFLIVLRWGGFLQLLELTAYDRFFRWRPPEPTDSRIALVEINESDIRKAGQWPISDRVLAELLNKIKQQKPRAIGLDIYRDLRVEPGHEELVKVFKTTPNLIGIQKVVKDAYGESLAPPPILDKLGQVGASNMLLDEDGKVRRALLSVKPKHSKTIYSFSAQLALIYLKAEGIKLQVIDANKAKIDLGKAVFVPLRGNEGGYVGADTGGYQILFNYRSHHCRLSLQKQCHVFPTVSMTEVLEDRIPPDFMRSRIVLIGASAESLKDRFFSPYSNSYLTARTGVEIHADLVSQIISAAIDGRPLIQVWEDSVEAMWIVFWSFVGATLGWVFLRIRWKVASIFLAGSILTASCYVAFLGGWWIPVIPPLLALFGSGVTIAVYIAYLERQDRQAIMNLLGQHVTPKIAQAVWRDRHQLLKEGQLMGQKMTATVLFTDLKGFTGISERTDPETLMSWLNEYMSAMSQIILDRDGVIDKFIGDAIMAVFGVPIPSTTPEAIAKEAISAVSCALDMATKVRSLNQQWQAQKRPTVSMRVGIATGTVVAGSLGSYKRLNYTTIGDSVNVAARLESYDKSIDGGICRILIDEETYGYIQGIFPTQFIGSVQLKGREQPVKIYQVLSE
ncbi:CHASE2 domain-containing protein [Aerosakkonema funiforme]|uniref:Adenylate/guanylate cyclase domain-containing protein n=1 Tax=Aerosakkonema funiforme FACHB-1375 TaxID=2949571 RepID=A0A926VF43_9CYAN|nr:adenylate/guanylate cyclase domain-containing protein [Aerosakkonema funiforme]MBD2182597.1 adenylate/guanylate cyclase domain-containing protein [Aerosakkonema funiforme FACHB-1375]